MKYSENNLALLCFSPLYCTYQMNKIMNYSYHLWIFCVTCVGTFTLCAAQWGICMRAVTVLICRDVSWPITIIHCNLITQFLLLIFLNNLQKRQVEMIAYIMYFRDVTSDTLSTLMKFHKKLSLDCIYFHETSTEIVSGIYLLSEALSETVTRLYLLSWRFIRNCPRLYLLSRSFIITSHPNLSTLKKLRKSCPDSIWFYEASKELSSDSTVRVKTHIDCLNMRHIPCVHMTRNQMNKIITCQVYPPLWIVSLLNHATGAEIEILLKGLEIELL